MMMNVFFCFLEEFDKGGYIRKNNIRIVRMVHNIMTLALFRNFWFLFLKKRLVSGYSLRYDEYHNHDNGFNQNMHRTNV